jgi:outer membrane immunogenic protein
MKAIFFLAGVALAALAGRAAAADLPAATTPPPPPVFSWTGFYLGADVGYTWGASNGIASYGLVAFDRDPPFGAASALGASGVVAPNFNGAFGGGQVGYNYQFSRFVIGAEADGQAFAVQGSETAYSRATAPNLTGYSLTALSQASRNIDFLATFRGRAGVAVRPEALLYVTGGLAVGRVSHMVTQTQYANWAGEPGFPAGTEPFGFGSSSYAGTRVGWAAGAGVEWAFRGNWSAKLEYLYYDLGRVRSLGLLGSDSRAIRDPDPGASGLVAVDSTSRFNGHILRAGLNYRFEFFRPPVVAAY